MNTPSDSSERAERRRALENFANTAPPNQQPLPAPVPAVSSGITPIGAQPVATQRDEGKILQKLTTLGAAAGGDWFYRFPAGKDWVEGPSIKLANDVARIFGNCVIEVRELDVGNAFVFYARFTDIETGFSMERSYRQRKSQSTFKSKDADRQLDILYQIGQSKAIRNVIVNSLQIYADFAFEVARNSLVDKIGKDLDGWRQRTLDSLARLPVDLHRVETRIGRTAKNWLASDIAQIVAMGRACQDGMATVDETFPDQKTTETPSASAQTITDPQADAAAASPAGEVEGAASGPATASPPAASDPAAPKNLAEYLQLVEATCATFDNAEELMRWFRSEPQRRLRNAVGLVAEQTVQAKGLINARIKELQG